MHIYRRHSEDCEHRDQRHSRECRCPLWAKGTIDGKLYQRSLKTRNFRTAESKINKILNGDHPKEQSKSISIKDALDAFIKDCEGRNLNASTQSKYKLLRKRLLLFCDSTGLVRLDQIDRARLSTFRERRLLSPRTASKELERLRAFFRFCIENGWLTSNPAKTIKAPQVKINPRIPFSEKEIQAIISKAKDDRELAFILVLRYTGLRIGDGALLRISSLSDNRIHLYTTKSGVPVSVLIPPNVVSLLKAIPPRGGYFFVRGDSTSMHTVSDLWRRRFKIICKEAKVTPDHPHRMRHTLAADLLSKGVSVENVAAILGNSPAIVSKHYSQWISSRQDALDAALQSTWKPNLRIVTKQESEA